MTGNAAVLQPKEDRPLGVWLLTIYAAIFAGIFPLILSVWMMLSGVGIFELLSLVFNILFCGGVIYFAIGAWQGKERARKSLLVFVTLYYGLVAFNNLLALVVDPAMAEEAPRLVGRILRGLTHPAIYIWYFNRHETKRFYY